MKKFSGYIKHNNDTIHCLFKITYETYEMKKILLRFLTGLILTVCCFLLKPPIAVQGIAMMIGCWLMVSFDFPAKCRAEQVLERREGKLPVLELCFYEEHMELFGEGTMSLTYQEAQHLVRNESYYFIFFGRDSVCMIDKGTVTPADVGQFEDFVEKKTGLEWREPAIWFRLSLKELLSRLFGFEKRTMQK